MTSDAIGAFHCFAPMKSTKYFQAKTEEGGKLTIFGGLGSLWQLSIFGGDASHQISSAKQTTIFEAKAYVKSQENK